MRNRTKKLVKQIRELEYVEDRLALLHETYSDCKAVILAPGPSLNDYENIKKKVYCFTKEIDRLERNDVSDLEEKLKRINKLKERIRKFRRSGLDKGGEYSVENLTFKVLRMNNYLKKLSDLKKNTYDEMMSLEEQL